MLSKIKKIIIIFALDYPIYFLSFLFLRKKKRWIFSSGNSFSDNTKYLYIDIVENHKDIEAIWVSSNKQVVNELKTKKFNAYDSYSLKGIYYLMTSNIYIISNYPNSAIPLKFMGYSKYIQLWHGVGVKKVLFLRNDKLTYKRLFHPLLKWLYLPFTYPNTKKPNKFLSTSESMNEHFSKCFNLKKENIIESFYPRCSLFLWNKEKLVKFINKYESDSSKILIDDLKKFKKVFIYMPTFRENNPNYLNDTKIDFELLNNTMIKLDSIFIFKLHPWSKVQFKGSFNKFKNLLFLNTYIDIYPILPFTDVLITDYSSIYYDYLLMEDKFTIFFDFDRESYIDERDFAFDYDEYTNGLKVKTFDELLYSLEFETYKKINLEKNKNLLKFFWGNKEDKMNLINEIRKLEN